VKKFPKQIFVLTANGDAPFIAHRSLRRAGKDSVVYVHIEEVFSRVVASLAAIHHGEPKKRAKKAKRAR